jgi:hypothetical protein
MVVGEVLVEDEGVLVVVGAMEEVAEVVVEAVVAPGPTQLPLKRVSLLLCLGEQAKQWEQWQKGKSSECLTSPDGQATNSFGNFANYAHMGECNTPSCIPRIIESYPQFPVPHLHHKKSIHKI